MPSRVPWVIQILPSNAEHAQWSQQFRYLRCLPPSPIHTQHDTPYSGRTGELPRHSAELHFCILPLFRLNWRKCHSEPLAGCEFMPLFCVCTGERSRDESPFPRSNFEGIPWRDSNSHWKFKMKWCMWHFNNQTKASVVIYPQPWTSHVWTIHLRPVTQWWRQI